MKAVGVLVLCVLARVHGAALSDGRLTSFGSDGFETEQVPTSTNPRVAAREFLVGALKHLSQDLKQSRSTIETKLKSVEKLKLDLEHINALDLFVNISLNTINSEDEDNLSGIQGKKKYSVFRSDDKVGWHGANTLCQDKEMELASVESEEEQRRLEAAIESSGFNPEFVWIGARQTEDEGAFSWSSSGRPLSYTNWLPIQEIIRPPNSYKCVELSRDMADPPYHWLRFRCEDLLNYYACEQSQ